MLRFKDFPSIFHNKEFFVLILRKRDRKRTGSEKFAISCFRSRLCCLLGRVASVIQLSDMTPLNGHAMKAINTLLFILTTGQGKPVKFNAQILGMNQPNHVN